MRHCATTIHSGASKVCIYKFVSPHMRVCRAALRVCAVLLNSQQTHAHTQSSKRKGVRCFFVYIDTILITKSISKHEGLGLFGCWARSSTPRLVGRGPLNNRTKRSIVDNATSGHAPTPRAWSLQTGQCSGEHGDHPGPCSCRVSEISSGGRAIKQESCPELRSDDVSVVRTRGYTMTSPSPT